jgi:tetratricopeptide (TPR) repeat protein
MGSLHDRAQRHRRAGNLAGAEQLYRRMLNTTPQDGRAHQGLAIVFAQQGRLDQAIDAIARAVAAEPGNLAALTNQANLLAAADRLEEALASYEAALRIAPRSIVLLQGYAAALQRLARPAQAADAYGRLLALQPDNAEAHREHADILAALGRTQDALAGYDAALELKPQDPQILNNRGNLLRQMRRFAEALDSYDHALAIAPGLAVALTNRGVALSELGRFEEALANHESALAVAPTLTAAMNNRGFTLRQMGRTAEALASYDQALALEPDYPAALNNRAKALCEIDRIDEGFADFMRAAALTHVPNSETPDTPEHRLRHDREQQIHLAMAGRPADAFHIEGGTRLASVMGPGLAGVTAAWRAAVPGIVVIDGFLSPEALAQLRRFCWGSTIWRRNYENGYLGAFPETGFACPLLAQIASALRAGLPDIFAPHPLRYLWAFKYDGAMAGTAIHADEAAVNVNFWITPDEANRDPQSGGLVVWDKAAPLDWNFDRFNNDADAARRFLEDAGASARTIAHRANRAVIFDSNLFHATDRIAFRPGYTNRRINITLLYGRRGA